MINISVLIDGKWNTLEMYGDETIPITKQIVNVDEDSFRQGTFSQNFEIPFTEKNKNILKHIDLLSSFPNNGVDGEDFNYDCLIEYDGYIVAEGFIQLDYIRYENGFKYGSFNFFGSELDLFRNLTQPLNIVANSTNSPELYTSAITWNAYNMNPIDINPTVDYSFRIKETINLNSGSAYYNSPIYWGYIELANMPDYSSYNYNTLEDNWLEQTKWSIMSNQSMGSWYNQSIYPLPEIGVRGLYAGYNFKPYFYNSFLLNKVLNSNNISIDSELFNENEFKASLAVYPNPKGRLVANYPWFKKRNPDSVIVADINPVKNNTTVSNYDHYIKNLEVDKEVEIVGTYALYLQSSGSTTYTLPDSSTKTYDNRFFGTTDETCDRLQFIDVALNEVILDIPLNTSTSGVTITQQIADLKLNISNIILLDGKMPTFNRELNYVELITPNIVFPSTAYEGTRKIKIVYKAKCTSKFKYDLVVKKATSSDFTYTNVSNYYGFKTDNNCYPYLGFTLPDYNLNEHSTETTSMIEHLRKTNAYKDSINLSSPSSEQVEADYDFLNTTDYELGTFETNFEQAIYGFKIYLKVNTDIDIISSYDPSTKKATILDFNIKKSIDPTNFTIQRLNNPSFKLNYDYTVCLPENITQGQYLSGLIKTFNLLFSYKNGLLTLNKFDKFYTNGRKYDFTEYVDLSKGYQYERNTRLRYLNKSFAESSDYLYTTDKNSQKLYNRRNSVDLTIQNTFSALNSFKNPNVAVIDKQIDTDLNNKSSWEDDTVTYDRTYDRFTNLLQAGVFEYDEQTKEYSPIDTKDFYIGYPSVPSKGLFATENNGVSGFIKPFHLIRNRPYKGNLPEFFISDKPVGTILYNDIKSSVGTSNYYVFTSNYNDDFSRFTNSTGKGIMLNLISDTYDKYNPVDTTSKLMLSYSDMDYNLEYLETRAEGLPFFGYTPIQLKPNYTYTAVPILFTNPYTVNVIQFTRLYDVDFKKQIRGFYRSSNFILPSFIRYENRNDNISYPVNDDLRCAALYKTRSKLFEYDGTSNITLLKDIKRIENLTDKYFIEYEDSLDTDKNIVTRLSVSTFISTEKLSDLELNDIIQLNIDGSLVNYRLNKFEYLLGTKDQVKLDLIRYNG